MSKNEAPIWWSNAILFCGMHVLAVIGVFEAPLSARPWQTIVLSLASWQVAVFGITIGYHRLWSHRAFTARRPLRVVLALMGCLGFQGSIKWWCARHRLHHRYTDDPEHDPYSASKGLFYSHMGWIFRQPVYKRLPLVDRSDLDRDPVVRYQHRYYLPLALSLGVFLPAVVAMAWHDACGGLIWGGLIARILTWHCTFIVNSFAHWEGLQPYSDEMTARGNLIMALLTGGEGNHNFHAFPYDFRAGPNPWDWDPSQWIIKALYKHTNLVTSLRIVDDDEIEEAKRFISHKSAHEHRPHIDNTRTLANDKAKSDGSASEEWGYEEIRSYIENGDRSLLFIDEWILDITDYVMHHPGGYAVIRPYVSRRETFVKEDSPPKDASWAFGGGLNNHSRMAKTKMRRFRIARIARGVALGGI